MDYYQEIYYHFVWATKQRAPMITERIERHLMPYFVHQCNKLNAHLYAVNSVTDHVHLACSLTPQTAPADFIEKIKGGSAHFINHLPEIQSDPSACLYWQRGYGVVTFSTNQLQPIINYIARQKEHHASGGIKEKWEPRD